VEGEGERNNEGSRKSVRQRKKNFIFKDFVLEGG